MADIKNLKVDLKNKILSSDKVIIVPHKNPDLDALGSAVGILSIANKLRKDFCSLIVVDTPQPNNAKMMLEEMKGDGYNIISADEYLENEYRIDKKDLVILTDVNSSSRIPISIDGVKHSNIIVIDHHVKSADIAISSTKFIDLKSSSASEIVAKLLCQFSMKYKAKLANYLLAGIYLDTNQLQSVISSDKYPDAMTIVEKLKKKHKASPSEIQKYFMEDFAVDRKIQRFIDNTQFIETYAITTGHDDEIFRTEELAKAADYLLKFPVDTSFTIGRVDEDSVGISARAKDNSSINISKVMHELGGGGNLRAAATSISSITTEEAEKKLIKVLSPNLIENI